MLPKTVLVVLFAFIVSVANSEDSIADRFFVVSTTEHPSGTQIHIEHLTKKLQDALNALQVNITNHLNKSQQETEKKLDEKFSKMRQEFVDSMQALIVKIPRDCKEVQNKGFEDSGVYRIQPYLASEEFEAFCDMTTREGGWTHVINRMDGSQNFTLNWIDYRNGFGDPKGDHWIGLEHLYQLTNSKPTELLIELIDWDSKKVYAHYKKFKIGNESDGYKLKVLEGYSGDAGDSLTGHLGNKFSTVDRDQDTHADSCAKIFHAAWWYSACYSAHLTGRYVKNANPVPYATGIHWNSFHGLYYSLKEVRMMIRPLSN